MIEFSIIILAYNATVTLPRCLDAAQHQSIAGTLTEGSLLGEIGALLDWDEPGKSTWVTTVDDQIQRIVMDPFGA